MGCAGFGGGSGSGSPGTPFLIARTEELSSQVLPASGVFTAQGFTTLPANTEKVAYWVSYTRGAAGGYPVFQPEWTDATEQARELILEPNALSVAAPNASAQLHQERLYGPAPQDDNTLVYVLEFVVPRGATGVRLLAAELGVTGSPGTIEVALTGGGIVV